MPIYDDLPLFVRSPSKLVTSNGANSHPLLSCIFPKSGEIRQTSIYASSVQLLPTAYLYAPTENY